MTGLELKLRRIGARVTGRALAQAMGVTPSRISSLEREAVVTAEAQRRYLAALETLTHVDNVAAA